MPTPAERRALLFLAIAAALGAGVRAGRALRDGAPPGAGRGSEAALDAQIHAADSARGAESRRRRGGGGGGGATRSRGAERGRARGGAGAGGDSSPPSNEAPAWRFSSPPSPGALIQPVAPRASDAGIRAGARASPASPASPAVPIVDLDVATAREIEALPGIGPALAARIVADRDSLGAFGSLDALQRVRGVGPALARRIAPYVTFSALSRP